jgi:hypothetical protein
MSSSEMVISSSISGRSSSWSLVTKYEAPTEGGGEAFAAAITPGRASSRSTASRASARFSAADG